MQKQTGMKTVNVVVAHYDEDLSWTNNLKYPYIVISRSGIDRDVVPNRGNEAGSYLEYIINNYDNLSDVTVFVHGHRRHWHNNCFVDEYINECKFEHDYYNINTHNSARCPERSELEELRCSGAITLLRTTKRIVEEGINDTIDIAKLRYRASAMFYVKRQNIHRHSLDVYKKWYNFIMNTPMSVVDTGKTFEYTWHVIFTGDHVDKY